ncbi:MAG: EAL domain-containing protein [Candidatus Thiodiazotropha taylori]|nr:EAL domain-containing protein [Candidatus Thiodiazotropha taylori]MCW4246370.1 EAL domain-containing protein [Candidatus Thiodiazotropha taylori]
MKTLINKHPIYVTLGIIIISAVAIISVLQSTYSYLSTKHRIENEMRESVERSIISLNKNIATYLSSYAVNEYQKLVTNELERRNSFAIVVEDYNMGTIMGVKAYVSGKIRDDQWRPTDFNPNNTQQNRKLEQAYYSFRQSIVSSGGEELGAITIYISDHELRAELREIVVGNLISTISISLLLIVSLFVSIRLRLLKPIAEIAEVISHADKEGIPHENVPCAGPQEITTLSKTMNRMIDTIRSSRSELITKQTELEQEKERFKLAIDGANDGLWDWNLKTNEVYHSPRFETMLGYQVGELPNSIECWSELLHPEDSEQAHRRVKEYLETKGEGRYENTFRMQTKSGDWRWITGRGKALFDETGTAVRFVGFNTDITKLIIQQEELQHQRDTLQFQASHDALTDLANRTLFTYQLEQGIDKAVRDNSKLALLFIDLDHFKEINDSLGHRTGDEVLKTVTLRLKQTVRAEDAIARLGGDEFTILIEDLKQDQDASRLAEKIQHKLSNPIIVDNHELYITISIGISIYPDNGKTSKDLLKNADAAMYKAKSEGRNNFQYYSAEMTAQAFERVQMETRLRMAIENDEFVVFYQPQFNGVSNRLVGMEALVRWQAPSLGLIFPSQFIPIAESTGLIVEIDRLVMRKAVAQFSEWYRKGLQPGTLSLNLSMRQLQRKDLVEFLLASLEDSGCSPEWLEMEITEGHVMENPEEAIKVLSKIDNIGIKLALDDFGTGYSSLSYLKRLPITKLKIDRSFIKDLPNDTEDRAISKAVIALAKSLDLEILAEGVETIDQIEFLVENGCVVFQGFFYSKAIPVNEMEAYLEKKTWVDAKPSLV